jgi:hypothetical protein
MPQQLDSVLDVLLWIRERQGAIILMESIPEVRQTVRFATVCFYTSEFRESGVILRLNHDGSMLLNRSSQS